jgi:hypothetical protein
VLLLSADPYGPPQDVPSVYVLVCDIIDYSAAAGSRIRFDVYSLDRIMKTNVEEFAATDAVYVDVRRYRAHRCSHAIVDVNVMNQNIFSAV